MLFEWIYQSIKKFRSIKKIAIIVVITMLREDRNCSRGKTNTNTIQNKDKN